MNTEATETGRAQAAPVMEVFASLQGEGTHVGEPQVFLRLAGCPLRCHYCDTPGSWDPEPARGARVATPTGTRREEGLCSPFQATCLIAEVESGPPRTVSVTGGEPLLWPEFLLGLAKVIGPRRLHLETAGAHPETLERVIDVFDHVSLDLKLERDLDPPVQLDLPAEASTDGLVVTRTEEAVPGAGTSSAVSRQWIAARARSLRLLRGRDACAKIVLCGETPIDAYEELLHEVAEYAPEVPVILQPATPMRDTLAPRLDEVMRLADVARERGLVCRVLPQVHRALNIP